jgi:hypothetical protein
MTAYHGKNTGLYVGGRDLSTLMTSVDMSVELDVADTTTFQATWKQKIVGAAAGKVDFSGLYDPGQVIIGSDPGNVLLSLVPAPLTYLPTGGGAIGSPARFGSANSVAYAESAPVGGVVAIKGSFTSEGAFAFGDVLHPFAADTNTTTGADRDDTTATATGWSAALHVTYITAGSWVVKLQDAATNDWADVSDGAGGYATFTAATTPTSQMLVSATNITALRRHVRYIATLTGGAGSAIYFLLSYSRNR